MGVYFANTGSSTAEIGPKPDPKNRKSSPTKICSASHMVNKGPRIEPGAYPEIFDVLSFPGHQRAWGKPPQKSTDEGTMQSTTGSTTS